MHGHGHGEAQLAMWRHGPTLRLVLAFVVACGAATAIGIVALWPSGEGRDAAIAAAEEIGLASERVGAVVVEVRDGPCSYATPERPQDCRLLTFELSDGRNPGAIVELPEFNLTFDQTTPDVSVGDRVVLGYEPSTDFYFYADRERRSSLVWLTVLFAAVVIALGRFRGLLALVAMALTLAVLVGFVAPSVLDGHDPVLVCVLGASAIAFVSLYLTHGVTPTTTVALAGTLGALVMTLALSAAFWELADFTGFATEEALILPFIAGDLDVASLMLGGAVIGALGALDDVTITQVATVAELNRRSPGLTRSELIASGIRVGREHIASTVNTLLLAYAGAAIPLLLLFAASEQSLSTVANSELVAVEIVRTLCGSIGLVAAVPITTALAAIVVRRPPGHAAEGPSDQPTWDDSASAGAQDS